MFFTPNKSVFIIGASQGKLLASFQGYGDKGISDKEM
jgi:hypothetical protein